MTRTNGNPPAEPGDPETSANQATSTIHSTAHAPISSRQVCWWAVHEYVEETLRSVGSWPMIGTVAWENAPDAVKLASIFDAARHWALHVESNQQAMAEASHAISAAADWPHVAGAWLRHAKAVVSDAYIPRVAA